MRRNNNNTSESNVNSKVVISGWKLAREEATAQLAELRVRTARLKAAIKLFAAKEKAGEPWLDSDSYTVKQKAGTARESVPA